MTPERWHKVKELFEGALERAPEQRPAFLGYACAGDEAVRREVESLLASHDEAPGFMETPAANSLPAERPKLAAGRRIGQFEVISPLGEGGMGEVYLANDSRLGRQVALKVLPSYFTHEADRVRRFEQEARSASSLNHPNILTIHEIGQVDGRHFIAAEFIEGETLRQRMSAGPMEVGEVLEVAVQVASALAAAHQSGVVHRDIKPENIMLRKDHYVKVLDFGLAKLTEHQTPVGAEAAARALVKTIPGTVMGTPHYMSPEQARGLATDARTDIWSLGVVLYEMAAGRLPFGGGTATDVLASIVKTEPALLRLAPIAPDELERIVTKALAKDPEERYQTSKDMLVDLRRLRKRLEFEAELGRAATPEAGTAPGTARPTSGAELIVGGIKWHRLGSAVASAVLLLAAVGFGYWFSARRPAGTTQIESIAVLPFANASGNADVEYLSDGLTESLINSLSQLLHVRVLARSTMFRFKGRDADPQKVGQQLGVDAVLTGRVVQRGESLTVQADLVSVSDGAQMWGERYNRGPADILAVQEEIVRDVSQKLRSRLSGADKQRVMKGYTENAEAYRIYLKGRFYWNKRTEEGIRKGIGFFQQAIDKDPNFALSYVGLADSYTLLGVPEALTAAASPQETVPQARAAAERALAIDSSLAEAHASLAHVKWSDRDWAGAGAGFERSFELNPNYATGRHWNALYLANLGRLDEALEEIKRAQELDPLSLPINSNLASVLYSARRYDEAIDQCQKTLDMDPTFALARQRLGLIYVQKGMYREAITEFQQAMTYSNRHPTAAAALAHAYAMSGDQGEAQKVLGELIRLAGRRYVSPYDVAIVYAGLGERERAYRWLERAVEQGDWVSRLKIEPRLDPLRPDPRFADLVRRVGLPQ